MKLAIDFMSRRMIKSAPDDERRVEAIPPVSGAN